MEEAPQRVPHRLRLFLVGPVSGAGKRQDLRRGPEQGPPPRQVGRTERRVAQPPHEERRVPPELLPARPEPGVVSARSEERPRQGPQDALAGLKAEKASLRKRRRPGSIS